MVRQRHPAAEDAARLGEGDPLVELDEADHVAPDAATVADEDAAVGVEVEVRAAAILVERAAGDERRAGPAEGEAVAGDGLGEGAAALQLGRVEPG